MRKVTFDRRRDRDLDDLIGGDAPPKRRPGRPRKSEAEKAETRRLAAERLKAKKAGAAERLQVKRADALEATEAGEISLSSRDIHLTYGGVSVQWLAKMFRLSRHIVEKKLGDLRPIGAGDYGNPLYSFVEAASYLVEPRVDIEKLLEEIKPEKLPEKLRESFWNAKLKEQRWKKAAGQLWDTDRVMSEFSEVLAIYRDKLQLIPDTVERLGGLDIRQWEMVRNLIDQVQDDIHGEIVRFASQDRTYNQAGEELRQDEDDLL